MSTSKIGTPEDEMQALREEARHWRREALKARAQRDAARLRSDGIERPYVVVERGETWWRVLVNGQRIDGYESEDDAQTIVVRLRQAFESKPR